MSQQEPHAHIDYHERMMVAVESAKQAQAMLMISLRLDAFAPASAVPESSAYWRQERHHWIESARFWRNQWRMHQGRNLAEVRAWIRGKHLLVFVGTVLVPAGYTLHCECCAHEIEAPAGAFYWTSIEDSDEKLSRYRLCGYCDVQCKVLANEFVRDLKHAIFNPESAIVGWPDKRSSKRSSKHE